MKKEHIETERRRTLEDLDKLYLTKDGNSAWYHAYEWSAYLAEFYKNGLPDKDRLKPSHKNVKGVEGSVIQVGLQLASIKKYFPNVITESVSDEMVVLRVNLGDYGNISSIDDAENALNPWKNSVEIRDDNGKGKEKKSDASSNIYNNPTTFLSIMKMIMRYDTNEKSEAELRSFIMALKNKCLDIIC